MSAKSEILRNIREALGNSPEAPVPQRRYRQTLGLSEAARIELFTDRLKDYNATVYRSGSLPDAIAEALRARNKKSLIIPAGLPQEWLPPGFRFIPDEALDYDTIDASEGALTACTAAIALTGTIILSH
ncbi:MAG: lactate utilization protein C, partial [Acidobacteriota bacterium]